MTMLLLVSDSSLVTNPHSLPTSLSPSSPSSHRSSSFIFPEIKTCRNMRDLKQLHGVKIKTGRIHDPFVAAEILRFCAFSDHGDLEYAGLVFDRMEEPNCFSWNTIIRALSDTDNPLEAFISFCRMLLDEFVEPNRFTFPSVLKACAEIAKVEEGMQIHGQVIKRGLETDEFILSNLVRMYMICGLMKEAFVLFNKFTECDDSLKYPSFDHDPFGGSDSSDSIMEKRKQEGIVVLCNVMIDGCMRHGKYEAARKLFDEMPKRSVVSWNGILTGYARNGFFKEALEIFREMQLANLHPNYVTLVSVLPAISRLGFLNMGIWIHVYAEKNKIKLDDVLGSALIDMYSKCGSIELGLKLFERLPKRSAITWNAIIVGLAMHGQPMDALHYFSKMEQFGIVPSDVTYIGVLTACSHAGLVDEGRSYFDRMVRINRLTPGIEHYGCIVDMLGRAGLLDEAEESILNMPIKPDDVIWKALLGHCRIHGNIEMGERAAKCLMELAPQDSGSYVALSNMYASVGNWDAVAEMRLMMKELDIRKDPGCSWIEVDGVIHEFLVEDHSHPRAREIHLMLEEMAKKLRVAGYKPDTTYVLLNVDEEERESALYYHSEKIAIAFGLVSTCPRTPLRIVKNLRICGDCHSSLKLVSKLYDRKIIVRDRNRFHHFENGSCSCMDFW